MAQVQLNLTLPDDKLLDILQSLRMLYGDANATPEQIIALLEGEAKTRIRNAYVAYMRSKDYELDLG